MELRRRPTSRSKSETPNKAIEYDLIYASTALTKKLNADGWVDKYKVGYQFAGIN